MGTIYNMVKWYKGWCSHLHRTEPRGATVQPDSDIPALVGFVCHALSLSQSDVRETLAIVIPLLSCFCPDTCMSNVWEYLP